MVLHTIVDINEVMSEGSERSIEYYRAKSGCIFGYSKRADGHYLERVISTDLRDYLNSSYKIGETIQNNRVL